MKKTYFVTDIAGPIVAGMKSPGAGMSILLSDAQAEHPLRLGHVSAAPPAPVEEQAEQKLRDPLDHDGDGRKGGSVGRKSGRAE